MSDSSSKKQGTVEQNNFFEKLMSNPEDISTDFTGPEYSYWKQIKSPEDMGMSAGGSIGALENDVSGLINYVKVLVTGQGGGSYPGRPLGNKYFLQTGGTCKARDTNDIVTRYLYVNNVPTGNIPFISQAAGENFDTFEGLIPGILQDLEALNPVRIFAAFKLGEEPPCRKITMETSPTSENNNQERQTEYVADYDIRYLGSCLFNLMGNKNPVTGEPCREGFNTRGGIQKHQKHKSTPMNFNSSSLDISEAIFYFILSGLILFIIYKISIKSMK